MNTGNSRIWPRPGRALDKRAIAIECRKIHNCHTSNFIECSILPPLSQKNDLGCLLTEVNNFMISLCVGPPVVGKQTSDLWTTVIAFSSISQKPALAELVYKLFFNFFYFFYFLYFFNCILVMFQTVFWSEKNVIFFDACRI